MLRQTGGKYFLQPRETKMKVPATHIALTSHSSADCNWFFMRNKQECLCNSNIAEGLRTSAVLPSTWTPINSLLNSCMVGCIEVSHSFKRAMSASDHRLLWSLHPWRRSRLSWIWPWATWSNFEVASHFEVVSAVSGRWTRWHWEVPSSLSCSMLLSKATRISYLYC